MNLKNIVIGMIIKNYKELCFLLEEPILDGNSKKAQMKEWSRYFDFEKQGHKFIIKEIYDIPLPEDFSENDIYSKYIQVILTKYLKEEGCGDFTMTQLLKLCGFVNENWDDMTLLSKYTEENNITYPQSKYYYNQLYQHVYSYCTKALTRCLDRLSKRKFLNWKKILYIKVNNVEHEATIEEETKYMNIVYSVRQEMEINRVNVYNRDEYYKEINKRFNECGWDNAIYLIRIVYATDFIDNIIKESEEKYRQSIINVNKNCLNQMYKYIDVDIENDIKKQANKMNEDFEIIKLCTNVDVIKNHKTKITNMYVEVSV